MSTFKGDKEFKSVYDREPDAPNYEKDQQEEVANPKIEALQNFIEKRNELYFDHVSKEANVDGQTFVDIFIADGMNDSLFTTPIKKLEETLSKLGIDNLKSIEFINTINAVREAYEVK